MRPILYALTATFAMATAFGGERPKEIDSHEAGFHTMLHDGEEFYLVCYTMIKKMPWGDEWEQLEISATITEVIRGDKKVGDKITFRRVLDGRYGNISGLHGSLNFVRFDKILTDGKESIEIDRQDPQAIFRYTDAFHELANEHKTKQNKSEQATPRNPSD